MDEYPIQSTADKVDALPGSGGARSLPATRGFLRRQSVMANTLHNRVKIASWSYTDTMGRDNETTSRLSDGNATEVRDSLAAEVDRGFDMASHRSGWAVRVAMVAALTVLAVACTSCFGGDGGAQSPPPPTLVFGQSVGGVRVHESQTQVEMVLGDGKTKSSRLTSSAVTLKSVDYGGLIVRYAGVDSKHLLVVGVYTSSRRFRSSDGLGVGSTIADLRNDPAVDCSNAASLTTPSCQAPRGTPGVTTVLAINHGRVSEVFLGPVD